VAISGKYLFTEQSAGAAVYARVMTRLRACGDGSGNPCARLVDSTTTASIRLLTPWRNRARYFTPEEKTALEASLEKEKRPSQPANCCPSS